MPTNRLPVLIPTSAQYFHSTPFDPINPYGKRPTTARTALEHQLRELYGEDPVALTAVLLEMVQDEKIRACMGSVDLLSRGFGGQELPYCDFMLRLIMTYAGEIERRIMQAVGYIEGRSYSEVLADRNRAWLGKIAVAQAEGLSI